MIMTPAENLEQMKKRLEAVGVRQQSIQVRLEAARQQLAEGRKDAEATHKTSDVAELKAILARQEAANTQALGDFDKAVADYEAFVRRIEEAMSNPMVMAEMLTALPDLPIEPAAAPVALTAAQAGVVAEDI